MLLLALACEPEVVRGDSEPVVAETADSEVPCEAGVEICNGLDDDCDGEIDEEDADDDGYTVCDDCDETDPFVNPGMPEACDGLDNDCSGAADEPWDTDGDGQSACGGDCDEGDPDRSSHLPEVCDGLDNDCDEQVDEGFDEDGDGVSTCHGDCDDTRAEVYPGAPEVCDGLDNDCDPETDEDDDVDQDGASICEGDCDDAEPLSAPGQVEVCDEVDNDCNGRVDEIIECFDCTEVDGYQVCLAELDQADSTAACEAIGGALVVLETAEESVAVGAAVKTLTTDRFWISLNDREEEDVWLWGDGSALAYTSQWSPGEPNDSSGEDCVHSNWNGTGTWNDIDCSTEQPFVCEGVE